MRKLLLAPILATAACATTATETSMQVIEYDSIEEMNKFADCQSLDSVYATFDVTLHSPAGRKRAAHVYLKDAAYVKGANAVIMTSNNWGVVTDQVQGVAYTCVFGSRAENANESVKRDENNSEDRYDQIREAKQLYDDGILSREEYEAEKDRILKSR